MWPWHMGSEWGWGGMIFGGLIMLVFWGAVIGMVVFAIRSLTHPNSTRNDWEKPPGSDPTALEILKARYARGEITREEFREMRRELED